MHEQTILGVDTGGTFTDFVLYRQGKLRLHKVLSTPQAPEKAILQGMKDLGVQPDAASLRIIHGTTVATNAALEQKGVRTLFVTNRGFRDMLSIGRQARKELYNLTPQASPPPVAQELCVETGGRLDATGNLIEPITQTDIDRLLAQIEALQPSAIAVCLLFSFLDDAGEIQLQEAIENHFQNGMFVTRSSWVLPEYKEYERGIATWYNAYLGPLVKDYLSRLALEVHPAPLAIMQSSGRTISADQAALRAVNLMLSGPAGGLAAVEHIGRTTGKNKLLSFDMGGTSTDVALINGTIKLTSEGKIGSFPVAVPMVDMHTIGAGGGSIAYTDDGGMLHVGPESAGAAPGPACYGQGGISPTVTDANALLGRLQPDNFLGGRMALRQDLAEQTITDLASSMSLNSPEAAQGIIDLANEHMAQALRLISEQRGHDPKEYVLCGFGGAGGLHICALAEALGISSAIVPSFGGVFSALGMLTAPAGRELSRAHLCALEKVLLDDLDSIFTQLEEVSNAELKAEGHALEQINIHRSVDCRYQGQSYCLNLPWSTPAQTSSAFHEAHQAAYGHCFDLPVELVNVRVSATLPSHNLSMETNHSEMSESAEPEYRQIWLQNPDGQMVQESVAMMQRDSLEEKTAVSGALSGPLLICEEASTTWIAPGWELHVDKSGNLCLTRSAFD